MVSLNVIGFIFWLGIRERSTFNSEKKRFNNTLVFYLYEIVSYRPFRVFRRGGMAGGLGFLWLRSLAHLSRF